jgi:hypothetical protein
MLFIWQKSCLLYKKPSISIPVCHKCNNNLKHVILASPKIYQPSLLRRKYTLVEPSSLFITNLAEVSIEILILNSFLDRERRTANIQRLLFIRFYSD